MRIVFVNLQINSVYVKNFDNLISGKRFMGKHRFILDWMLENNVEIANLITLGGSSLPSKILKEHTRNYKLRIAETKYIFKKNNIPIDKVEIITDPDIISPNDIVIYYGTFFPAQFENIDKVKGIKIVEHYHFFGDKEYAELIKDKGFKYYVFDVDLNKYSRIYRKNYSWFDGGFIMQPFTYQPRFCVKKQFAERMTKAVAMGTLTKRETSDFIKTYGTEYYQPRRKMIMDNASKYEEELDSFISEYDEKPLKKIQDKDNIFLKLYKKIYNYFTSGKQKAYFSFNMVDKYNEYKMFICPEDIQGSYGIGVIEGMACGCAMIGCDYGAFEDLGMEAGKHYISYDGTMEDLIEKIRYYQRPDNQKMLEKIAKAGCEFVREKFSQSRVAKDFYETLKKISEESQNNYKN